MMTFQEWVSFFQLVGMFKRLPRRPADDEEIRWLVKESTFLSAALYEDVVKLLPGEVGIDTTHGQRVVRKFENG